MRIPARTSYRLAVLLSACTMAWACSAGPAAPVKGPPMALSAGPGESIVAGSGSVPCAAENETTRAAAVQAALRNAVSTAAGIEDDAGLDDAVARQVPSFRVDRYWASSGRCFAQLQAVVKTGAFQRAEKRQTQAFLAGRGSPKIAFAVQSYRIMSENGQTTRRATAEPIDALQEYFLDKGFRVVRTSRGRGSALKAGGENLDSSTQIDSKERDAIASNARKDGVDFLIQGEIKVTDEDQQGEEYRAVADGSLEAIDLKNGEVLGSFSDEVPATALSRNAAYTRAIKVYAAPAVDKLAGHILDLWSSGVQ
ncbi:MAG: hypothetical protein RLZZ403_1947 [Pseudomonadota bacterium]